MQEYHNPRLLPQQRKQHLVAPLLEMFKGFVNPEALQHKGSLPLHLNQLLWYSLSLVRPILSPNSSKIQQLNRTSLG